jgi:putative transposase
MSRVLPVTEFNRSHYILIKDLNRGILFYENADYHRLIDVLKIFFSKYGCKLHSYVLMENHVHLLISCISTLSIITIINSALSQYADYFNFTHRRINKLLDLHHSIEFDIRDKSILSYYRFIELMPVRTGEVLHPSEYHWSSYGSNALGEDTGLVTPHNVYMSLAGNTASRWKVYRESFSEDTAHIDVK